MATAAQGWAMHGQGKEWVRPGKGGNGLTLHIAVASRCGAQKVYARIEPDNEEEMVELRRVGPLDEERDMWAGEVDKHKHIGVTTYVFKIVMEKSQLWLHAAGLSPRLPTRQQHFRVFHGSPPPEWFPDEVVYQIFPDRFANGDPSIGVRQGEYTYLGLPSIEREWGHMPEDTDEARCHEFCNGDLPGVIQRLDHLQELGVSTVYLNPIFTSKSNHKYDTINYFEVDPHLGGDKALVRLSDELHSRNMRLVLDAVLNHTSVHHVWFDKFEEHAGKKGAYNNLDSPHRQYYAFKGTESKDYVSWNGYDSLPKLDMQNDKVRQELIEGDKCFLRHWMRAPFNIDGWRLDAIHMIGEGVSAANNDKYLRMIRNTIKDERHDALVLGEHFHEATAWLQGDQEDSAMNYFGFLRPVWAFLGLVDLNKHPVDIDAAEFSRWLCDARATVPWNIQLCQLNLLDSHDTRRFCSVVKGSTAIARMAAGLLFTYPGVPCVYYGDEIGMEGEGDPDCRRCFPWDDRSAWNMTLWAWYRDLAALRRKHLALRRGEFLDLHADGDVFVFARFIGTGAKDGSVLVVALHRGTTSLQPVSLTLPLWRAGVTHSCKARTVLSSAAAPGIGEVHCASGSLQLTLPAGEFVVMEVETAAAASA